MERSPRPEKVAVVDEVRERFEGAAAVVLTEYRGINVSDMATLRRSITAAGGDYKVYKNTLVRLAIADLGVDGLSELMLGPTALAFVADDAASVAKALKEFSGTNEHLVIKGALLGTELLSVEQVMVLASLPSRDELLSKFAGGLQAPMTKFAMLLNATMSKFAFGLRALIDEQGGVPEAQASEAPSSEAPSAETVAPSAPESDATSVESAEDGAAQDSAAQDSAVEDSDAEDSDAAQVSDDSAADNEAALEAEPTEQAQSDEPESEETPTTES